MNRRLLFISVAFCWCISLTYFLIIPEWSSSSLHTNSNDAVVDNKNSQELEAVDETLFHSDTYNNDTKANNINSELTALAGPFAYVTFLCDDAMAEATQVLVHSLVVNARTKHDIIVLVLPPVSQTVREQLEYLGAQIIEIEKINYPWKETEAAVKKGYNKACRYSKLHLWNLTKYQKVVFLDADTLVVQGIDELFQRPQFSGAIDAGGVVNTGVFVAQPSKEIFRNMLDIYEKAPSYNRGDQGFLNWYFNQSSVHVLPGYYNLMIKFMHFSNLVASHVYRNTVKIVHFTSEIKPWNFYYLHNREWRDNYDTYLFDKWIKTGRNMRSRLAQGKLLSASGSSNSVSKACNAELKSNYKSRYPKTNKFTIILSSSVQMDNPTWKTYIDSLLVLLTTNTDDIEDIMVEKIFVVTKDGAFDDEDLNENIQTGVSMPKRISGVPIEWISSSENAFSVVHRLKTEGTLLLEDKVIPSIQDLEFAFKVWQKHPDELVGFDASLHRKNGRLQPKPASGRYSIIHSTAMFIKSDWLYSFTCLLPDDIHVYLHAHPQCTDIALNMFFSGTTSAQPILVSPSRSFYILDADQYHDDPSMCIPDLKQIMNGRLLYNDIIITRSMQSNNHKIQHSKPSMWRSLFAINM